MDPIEEIEFLSRSEHRVEILERLLDADPKTRHEFRECLNASRSTVSRCLNALQERGWITRDGRRYTLTPSGEIVIKQYRSLVDTIEMTDELSAFLDRFPNERFGFELRDITDASVTTSTPTDPYAPVRAHVDIFEEVAEFSTMIRSIDPEIIRTAKEQMHDRDFELEMIITDEIASALPGSESETLLSEMLAMDRFRLFVHDDSLPFYLGYNEDVVHIGVENENGYPLALLKSTNPSMIDWGIDVYTDHREKAREIHEV
jgi:predicted transcriptional regulator